MGTTDMVSGRSESGISYFPQKLNRPAESVIPGRTADQDHMANFVACVRSRNQPNAPVEIGYKSAIAAHMANMAYRDKRRVTSDELHLT